MNALSFKLNGNLVPFELTGGGRFVVSRKTFVSAYVRAFEDGVLQQRAAEAIESLRSCKVCPRDCEIDRFNNKIGVCKSGRVARVAVERGLCLPLVYNTSAYDSLESIRWMEGIVDIFMPDFELWDAEHCRKYLVVSDYAGSARVVIAAMRAQVGELKAEEQGLALRGLLVRHLVMPGLLDDTREIMR
jgi:uncharacterized Fe-S radical SAM superfamily protein PflX